MPHISIEYSKNVSDHHDIANLVAAVHNAALATGVVPADGLRTRAAEREYYKVASGHPDFAFVAITVRVGPGRDPETRMSLLTSVLDAAESQVATESSAATEPQAATESSPLAIAWSAEIQEIEAAFRINRNHIRTRIQETS